MKWIGLPLIMVCALCAGKGLYSELADRERLLSGLCVFIYSAAGSIRSRLTPLDRIIEESAVYAYSPGFIVACAGYLREGNGFHEAWRMALDNSRDIRLLTDRERVELERLGESLGYYDAEGEIALLGQAEEYFGSQRDRARGELREKSKMYMTCSLLTGLTAVLLLL